ncbi:MAG: DUF1841 family protein [Stellaceae bacterium]
MATFLLDVFCLGVKDVIFRHVEASELDEIVEVMAAGAPLAEVEPAYARKLLRDLVAYARSIGFQPPREYRTAELLFGDVSADACDSRFDFGRDGRPLYVPGPSETPAQVRQRLEQLRRSVGEQGFDFSEDAGDEEVDDESDPAFAEEDDDLFDAYDPAAAPDPAEWLELDEGERMLQVEYYHRRASLRVGHDRLHANLHVVVENQIALDDPPTVRRAMERLMGEGLDRHEALHAVGSVLAGFLFDAIKAEVPVPFSTDDYSAAIERLTAESWRRTLEEAQEAVESVYEA